MVDLSYLASLVIYGTFLGLLFALMAVGITVIFGLMKLVNFAHGEFYMLGGYVLYFVASWSGVNPLLALPIVFIFGFLVGQVVERFAIRATYTTAMERPGEYAILITFGISLFLQNIALLFWGYQFRAPSAFVLGQTQVLTLTIDNQILVASIASVGILVGLLLFMQRTWYGLAIRAVSQNLVGSATAGIDTSRTNNLVFGLGIALAATAGALLAPTYLVYPYSGVFPALQAFVVVVLGGLGSLKGSIVGSLVLGIAEVTLAALLSSAYMNVYGFVILITVLVLRPHGLFGTKGRTY